MGGAQVQAGEAAEPGYGPRVGVTVERGEFFAELGTGPGLWPAFGLGVGLGVGVGWLGAPGGPPAGHAGDRSRGIRSRAGLGHAGLGHGDGERGALELLETDMQPAASVRALQDRPGRLDALPRRSLYR